MTSLIEQARSNLEAVGMGEPIGVLVADAGYYSDANVTRESEGLPELLIATAKDWKQREAAAAHPPRGRIPKSLTPMQRMDRKLRTRRGQRLHRKRSQTVEPVFGQHEVRRLVRLHRRRQGPSRCEWIFENTAHNVLKLWRFGRLIRPASPPPGRTRPASAARHGRTRWPSRRSSLRLLCGRARRSF